jgi:penicillin-binding protein 1C
LVVTNARLPLPLQRFQPGAFSTARDRPIRIMYPPNGARLDLSGSGGQYEPIALKISGGAQPLTILANGAPVAAATDRRAFSYSPEGPGFLRLTVMDANGAADSVIVRVE